MSKGQDPILMWQEANDRYQLELNTRTPIVIPDPLRSSQTGGTKYYGINIATLGDRPYKGPGCRLWHDFFKVVDKKTFVLTPGQHQKYTFYHRVNRILKRYEVDNFSCIPGVNLWMVIIAKGQPCNGKLSDSSGPLETTTTDCSLGWVTEKKEWYQPVQFTIPIKWTNTSSFATANDYAETEQVFVNPTTNAGGHYVPHH